MPKAIAALRYVVDVKVNNQGGKLTFTYGGSDIVPENGRHLLRISGYLSFVVLALQTPEARFDAVPLVWIERASGRRSWTPPPLMAAFRDSDQQVSLMVRGLFVTSGQILPIELPDTFRPVVVYDGLIGEGPDPTIINVEPPGGG